METLRGHTQQHRQSSTSKQPKPKPTTHTTEAQSQRNKSREQRLRYLCAVLEFLTSTEPYFARELAACVSAIRRKALRTQTGDIEAVLRALADGGLPVEEIMTATGLPHGTVYAVLRKLEIAGLIGNTILSTREERLGKIGGPSQRLCWWLKTENPEASRTRHKVARRERRRAELRQ